MTIDQKIRISLGLLFVSLALGFFLYILPAANKVSTILKASETRVAQSATNYPNITTPLSPEIAADICKKFEIDPNDSRCQPNAIVYGPDFFTDIKLYFNKVPKEEATFELVQDKLGTYLKECERPEYDLYLCSYDLRGDGKYPILVYLTHEKIYYKIIADTFPNDS